MQRRTDSDDQTRKMHRLLPNDDLGVRLVSTLTCAGLGGGVAVAAAPGRSSAAAAALEREKTRFDRTRLESRWNGIYHRLWRYMTSNIKTNKRDILMEIGRNCTCRRTLVEKEVAGVLQKPFSQATELDMGSVRLQECVLASETSTWLLEAAESSRGQTKKGIDDFNLVWNFMIERSLKGILRPQRTQAAGLVAKGQHLMLH